MRTTLNIDDELLEKARQITGVTAKTTLVRDGLCALIEWESARRLARLGGELSLPCKLPRDGNPNRHDFGRHIDLG